MVNYSHGKIYKIVNDVNDIAYIGSTTQLLKTRMSAARTHARYTYTYYERSPFQKTMHEMGDEHFEMHLIKNFPCKNRYELEQEEYKIIQEHLQEGKELYNTLTKVNPKNTTRVESYKVPRGSVVLDGTRWRYSWKNDQGVLCSSSWSVRKYGSVAEFFALAQQHADHHDMPTPELAVRQPDVLELYI